MSRSMYCVTTVVSICITSFALTAQAQQPFRMPDKQVQSQLNRLASATKRYRNAMNDALGKSSSIQGGSDERAMQNVENLESSTTRLKEQFENKRVTSTTVQDVIRNASNVNSYMTRNFGRSRADEEWAEVKKNLETLAQSYNVRWQGSYLSSRPYRMTNGQVSSLLERIKTDAEQYRKDMKTLFPIERSVDRQTRDSINRAIRNIIDRSSRMRGRLNDDDGGAGQLNELMRSGVTIDRFMQRNRLTGQVQADWSRIRRNLSDLARGYKVSLQSYRS
ncbi:MAG: hypothetical protein L0226_14935 [Acidobacteria bacterium]|nr:hypothetical protein [Acidobacteriota bacterium]